MTLVLLVAIIFEDNPTLWPLPQSKFFYLLLGPGSLKGYYSPGTSSTLHASHCPQVPAIRFWTSTRNPPNLSGLQGPIMGCAKSLGQELSQTPQVGRTRHLLCSSSSLHKGEHTLCFRSSEDCGHDS